MQIEQLPIEWDAIVIGAGPAGAVSALQLSRRGWRVLLLERSAWPRDKVCGGCVNADAVAMLRSVGIELPISRPIDRCVIHAKDQSVSVSVPAGVSIDRANFDAMLVQHAVEAGCTFLDSASAVVADASRADVVVTQGRRRETFRARWVLACDGISGSSLARMPWARWTIAKRSHIGVAATVPADAMNLPAGEIHMHVGETGYVGRVRQADGTIHLAAALDPEACRAESPGRLAQEIFNAPSPIDFTSLRWSGIGKLTRHRQHLGGERILVVGDACGYVEPFTGQGISWAIESAIEATSMLLAADPGVSSLATQWEALHRQTVQRHQWACRAVRFSLRHTALVKISMQALNIWPAMPRMLNFSGRAIA